MAEVSQWLGYAFFVFVCGFQKQRVGIFLAVLSYGLGVFRGSKRNAVAEARFHCFFLWGSISLVLGVPKATFRDF